MSNLFHQNMQVFGGNAPARNTAYTGAFNNMRLLPAPWTPIIAAGFTEIDNNIAAATALGPLCAALGTVFRGVVACRITAVGHKIEYIGLGSVNVPLSYGRIMIHASGQGVQLLHDHVAPNGLGGVPAAWAATLPPNASADYQGLVYMIIPHVPGQHIAVSYLHNLYAVNDARSVMLQRLADAADIIAAHPTMISANQRLIYIGGDFNAVPENRHNRTGTNMIAYSQGTIAPPPPPLPAATPPQWVLTAAQAATVPAGGTTDHGSLIDYWYANIHPVPPPPPVPAGMLLPPRPGINVITLQGDMSNHVASLLQIT